MKFAAKEKFEGVTLRKSDVNGAYTRPLFAYLKRVTGKGYIQWYVHKLKQQHEQQHVTFLKLGEDSQSFSSVLLN